MFTISDYLNRIGLARIPELTTAGLVQLVTAQNQSLCFENLDVMANQAIDLQSDTIADKILRRGRGGYCFELNGLLAIALEAAGFTLTPMLARVNYRRPAPGPQTHLVLRVQCDNTDWLVDAGFGGPGLIEPMPFVANETVNQHSVQFRMLQLPDSHDENLQLQRCVAGEWIDLYRISRRTVLPSDIEVANHYVSTWPPSPFRNRFMCVRPLSTGLLMLQQKDCIQLDSQLQEVERTTIPDAPGLQSILQTRFGIQVELDIAERAWFRVMLSAA